MWHESNHQLLGFDQEARADTALPGMMQIEADTAKEPPRDERKRLDSERELRGKGDDGSGAERCSVHTMRALRHTRA